MSVSERLKAAQKQAQAEVTPHPSKNWRVVEAEREAAWKAECAAKYEVSKQHLQESGVLGIAREVAALVPGGAKVEIAPHIDLKDTASISVTWTRDVGQTNTYDGTHAQVTRKYGIVLSDFDNRVDVKMLTNPGNPVRDEHDLEAGVAEALRRELLNTGRPYEIFQGTGEQGGPTQRPPSNWSPQTGGTDF